jgi:hypothetical protein
VQYPETVAYRKTLRASTRMIPIRMTLEVGPTSRKTVERVLGLYDALKSKRAKDLSDGIELPAEDRCNIPWLSIHGLLRDLPGTVEIVLSCLSSVQ